jgi:hypothetical protein
MSGNAPSSPNLEVKDTWKPRQKSQAEINRAKRTSLMKKTNVSSFASSVMKSQGKDRESALSNMHDDEEDNVATKQSFAARIRLFLITSWVGVALDVFDAVLSIVACLMYVAEAYYRDWGEPVPEGLVEAEVILCLFFLAHFCLQLFVSVHRCAFLFSGHSFIDILIIVPPLMFSAIKVMNPSGSESQLAKNLEQNNFFVLMRIFRVLRIVRVSRELSKSSNFDSEIAQIFFDTSITVLTGVLIFTGVIHWVENIDYTGDWGLPGMDNGSPLCPRTLIDHPNRMDVDLDGCRNVIM